MPKREYVHLSLSERDLITTMLAEEKSLGEIAKALGRSKSTVSREIKRNSSPEYRLYLSHRAHGRAELGEQRTRIASQIVGPPRLLVDVGRILLDGDIGHDECDRESVVEGAALGQRALVDARPARDFRQIVDRTMLDHQV